MLAREKSDILSHKNLDADCKLMYELEEARPEDPMTKTRVYIYIVALCAIRWLP